MVSHSILNNTNQTVAHLSHFCKGKREIIHALISPEENLAGIQETLEQIKQTILQIESERNTQVYLIRLHLSDISTQMGNVKSVFHEERYALSAIGQSALPIRKVVAIAMFENGIETQRIDDNTLCIKNIEDESIYWTTRLTDLNPETQVQTHSQLRQYEKMLTDNGMTIAKNCVRTWFYVRDIDCHYHDVVVGRRENFMENNLTPDTHYIASTGIEGKHENAQIHSILDALAIKDGVADNHQILYASEYMNKTIEYGVTFERGACVHHKGDYKEVLISGTASIDNKGNVLHLNDIKGQTERMIENVTALLQEAQCDWTDMMHATVYLRDIADHSYVRQRLCQQMPHGNFHIVQAPVCRPCWLVEMEGMAMRG